jgi:GT2 family glycosyltransferase
VVLKKLKVIYPGFEMVWLLNNDTVVNSTSLIALKKSLLKEDNRAMSGSLILNYPDNGTIQCSGVKHYRFFGVSKLINKNKDLKAFDRNQIISFDYLNGASMLCRLSALEQAGYFDERFFLYSEELDLQLRLQELHYKLYLELNSEVYHKLGSGTQKSKHLFYYYYNTSAILLSRKHSSLLYTFCVLFNLVAITFIRTFPVFKSFSWGIKGMMEGLKK